MDFLTYYLENDSKKLKSISDYIIGRHLAWLPQMYYDDFYSIAGEVLWMCASQFESSKGAQFETYLIGCITKKFKTRLTYMNRKRRNNGEANISLDALIEDKDLCLLNMVASNECGEDDTYSDKMMAYLKRLSKLQKQVLFAMSEGYSNDEIKKRLNISAKQLADACAALRSYRNVSLLY